jgi:hypothetical protein
VVLSFYGERGVRGDKSLLTTYLVIHFNDIHLIFQTLFIVDIRKKPSQRISAMRGKGSLISYYTNA